MKKIIFTESLKNLLKVSKKNGSEIASLMLDSLKMPYEDVFGNSNKNYFDNRKVISGGAVTNMKISYCCKDNNEHNPNYNNPQFVYLPENRTAMSCSAVALEFRNIAAAYDSWDAQKRDIELKKFEGCMAIADEITFYIGDNYNDFSRAYLEDNYSSARAETNMHNSCMRGQTLNKKVADFYTNFAGAKILIAQTKNSGSILGRAILWDNITVISDYAGSDGFPSKNEKISFMDRIYYTYDFIRVMMIDYAASQGYHFRKTSNDHSSQRSFTSICNKYIKKDMTITLCKEVPAIKFHSGGSPYMDSMCYLHYDSNTKKLYLSNSSALYPCIIMGNLQSTQGYANLHLKICPICGKYHDRSSIICSECHNNKSIVTKAFDGSYCYSNTEELKGVIYPKTLIEGRGKKRRLTDLAQLAIGIYKLSHCE